MVNLHKGADILAWTEAGPPDGPLVVCCHGAGYDGSTFAGLAVALAARGYRVVLPDNRGAGASTDLDGLVARLGPDALVADLVDVLESVGATAGPALVVGHSLGGWTALGAAVAVPAAVRGLVLASTPAGIFTPEIDAFWAGFVDRLREGAPPEALAAIGLLRERAVSLEAVAAVGDRLPVAFVAGEDDRVYPPAVVRSASAAVPRSTCTVVVGAGHVIHLDAPDAVITAVADVERRSARTG
jgi:pimeloyl-ACP methyl ester carboxylesterase